MLRRFLERHHRSTSRQISLGTRRLYFEQCEDRRMLATMADIVFLVDESASSEIPNLDVSVTQLWLQESIAQFENAAFTESLTSKGITDVRYGLVGFGDEDGSANDRFSHSQVVDDTNFNQNDPNTFTAALFGNTTQLETAIGNLDSDGKREDGWDAIEHAIAEYDFRDGAVPIFVLVQDEEGRVVQNGTLTHDGILAALDSKNVILNSLVVGQNQLTDDPGEAPDVLYDLSLYDDPSNPNDNYSSDIRILGVEADIADGVRDRQHDYRWFDTDNTVVDAPTPTTADTLQVSYNGSNTGKSGMVATGKSVLVGKDLKASIGLSTEGYSTKAVSFVFEDLIDRATGNPVTGATLDGSFGTSEFLSDGALGAFEFEFYGTTYNQLYVRRDGYVNFQSSTAYSSSINADLSQAGGVTNEPIIAPLWDDFNDSGADGALVWKVDGTVGTADHRLIIQWEQVAYTEDFSENDTVTFQAILFADGQMRFNYRDLDSYPEGSFSTDETVNDTGGINATVGIWSGSEDPVDLAVDKFVPGLHSIEGATVFFDPTPSSQDDEFGTDTNDSYIRMAWDTGGAAWDLGIVKAFDNESATGADVVDTDELNALRDAFVDSLGDQILRAEATGKVFRDDQVLRSINFGGPAVTVEGFEADPATLTADNTVTTPGETNIDTVSNSIPEVGSPLAKAEEVFRSARTVDDSNSVAEDLNLSITTLDEGVTLQNGSYIVELFFAEIDAFPFGESRVFDILLEGQTVLTDYDIYEDRSKITSFDADELDASQAFSNTGTVKRFAVDVRGGDGLQINLVAEAFNTDPILSAVRILDAGPARIEDIIISGSNSVHDAYSFSEAFSQGIHEFQTVPVGGADTVEVVFTEWVDVEESHVELYGLNSGIDYHVDWDIVDFAFDDETFTARWRFDNTGDGNADPFPADIFGLTLYGRGTANPIRDIGGNALDGEWNWPAGLSDESPTSFPSGNGAASGWFGFTFVILPGDFDLDNDGDGAGFLQWQLMYDPYGTDNTFTDGDYDGDGDVDGDDLALWQVSYGLDFSSL